MISRFKRRLGYFLAAVLTAGVLGACDDGDEPATRVFKNGHIVTMDGARSVVQAVAIRGDRIVAVGSDAEMAGWIGPQTEVVDLAGRTMLPGFVDAHIHPVLGAERLGQCSMDGEALTPDQIVARARDCLATDDGGPDDWFQIVSVNPAGLVMTKADLDRISATRPIWAAGIDGHTGWANSRALQIAGIMAWTPNPVGGEIVHDSDGEPTGSLLDAAQGLVTQFIPEPTLEQRVAKTRIALALARSKGITSVKDAWASEAVMDVYDALEQDGTLNMRVRVDLASEVMDDPVEYARLKDVRARFAKHKLVRADGVKIFSDGVIEYPTQTAAMLTPYLGLDGSPTTNYGNRYFDQAVLERYVTRLDKDGFRINVHSIGNFTTRAVLDAFAKMRVANGMSSYAHQISHLEVIHPDDIPRFAKIGVLANMQMFWALPDVYTLDALKPFIDPQAHRYLYPAGSLKAAGATIVGGSDWPVDALPGDPMANTALRAIYMGVTRTNPIPDEHFGEVLYAEEQVDRDTMIAAYTINGARALGMERQVGSIEVGKLADFVIFDEDVTSVPIERLVFEIEVAATVFGGETVFDRATAEPAATRARPMSVRAATPALRFIRSHAVCGPGHKH